MMAVLRQEWPISCESVMLEMSVITSARWLAHVISTWPGILSGPAALFIFALRRILSHPLWLLTVAGPLEAEWNLLLSLCCGVLREHKMCSAHLVTWLHRLWGSPALVACDILNHLPNILSTVGVEVPLHSLLMLPICLPDACF